MVHGWQRVVVAAAVAVLTSSCSSAGPAGPTGAASPPASVPTGSPPAPDVPATGTPGVTQPTVLIVHRSRTDVRLSTDLAGSVLSGRARDWADLGEGPRRIRVLVGPDNDVPGATRLASASAVVAAVSADVGALGVVPGTAVTPMVRAVVVGGVHPLRDPSDYPLSMPGGTSPEVVTLSVVGDVMLGRRVGQRMAEASDFAAPLRPTARRLAAADLTIGNLESTLSTRGSPTQGGDSFAADPRVAAGLRLAGFDVLGLANNHVGDWGSRALTDTVDAVREMGILPVGAGANLATARRPVVVDVGDTTVGILAADSIGESPAAGGGHPGTNRLNMPPRTGPLDERQLARLLADVARLRDRVDLLVVMTHWGTQYTHRPEPSQHRVGRALVDAGADLVVGGHPHWVQGIEVVDGDRRGLIVHSLGNFVFDMDFMQRTREGVVLEAVLWGGELKALEPVPYVIGPDFAPRLVRGGRAEDVLAPFRRTSSPPFDAG